MFICQILNHKVPQSLKNTDLILTDPPRAGMNSKTREAIKKINPEKIVYISCNPATWARDAGDFIRSGFILKSIDLIDMFPGTMHIELISEFYRA